MSNEGSRQTLNFAKGSHRRTHPQACGLRGDMGNTHITPSQEEALLCIDGSTDRM